MAGYQSKFKGAEVDAYLDYVKKLQEEGLDLSDYAKKQDLDGKQDVITDLASIRSGASKGATAIQEHQNISHLATKQELQKTTAEHGAQIRENKDRIDTIEPNVTELSEKMDTLTGTGEGSIADITNKEVAKVIDSAPETMDTLKEIANLIEKDAELAADILATLGGHESRIETLENRIVVLSESEYENLSEKENKFYFCYEE